MAKYDYQCEKCGVFEVEHPMTADPLKDCPTCSKPVQRVFNKNVGVVFNGSGFYLTDSRKSSDSSE